MREKQFDLKEVLKRHFDPSLLCQIRHVQYHMGHCNSILRHFHYKAVEWIGYGEE